MDNYYIPYILGPSALLLFTIAIGGIIAYFKFKKRDVASLSEADKKSHDEDLLISLVIVAFGLLIGTFASLAIYAQHSRLNAPVNGFEASKLYKEFLKKADASTNLAILDKYKGLIDEKHSPKISKLTDEYKCALDDLLSDDTKTMFSFEVVHEDFYERLQVITDALIDETDKADLIILKKSVSNCNK